MYYKCILGSRSYNLDLPTSDYDILVCGDFNDNTEIPHSHEIRKMPDKFIRDILLLNIDAYYMQTYFPSEVLVQTELVDYILKNREDIIKANLDKVYATYMKKANSLSDKLDTKGMRFPKRAIYSCLFYDTLYRYATQNISFAEAFKPEESFRQWLLAIRRKEISKEEIIMKNEELRKKAESVSAFYIGVEDKKYLNQVISDLNKMLNTNVEFI